MEENTEIEIIEIIISSIDLYSIEKVKQLRNAARPKISQGDLSRRLDLADGFVSKVESYKQPSRYNLQQLNKLVKIFHLNSYQDFFGNEIIPEDLLKVRVEIKKSKVWNPKTKKFRSERAATILRKTPLNEKEFELWKNNDLKYLTFIQ